MITVSAMVILGSAVMIVFAEGVNTWSMVVMATVVLLAIVALLVASRVLRDVREGVPLQDERSRMLGARASHVPFYISMYATLALAFGFVMLEDRGVELPNSELLFLMVALMGSIHIAVSAYYNRRGARASS